MNTETKILSSRYDILTSLFRGRRLQFSSSSRLHHVTSKLSVPSSRNFGLASVTAESVARDAEQQFGANATAVRRNCRYISADSFVHRIDADPTRCHRFTKPRQYRQSLDRSPQRFSSSFSFAVFYEFGAPMFVEYETAVVALFS